MSYFHDKEFQQNLIVFLCRDRKFLKRMTGIVVPDDFRPRRGESPENHLLAKVALDFWEQYGEPIGGMLRTEVLDLCRERRFNGKIKDQLLDAVEHVRSGDGLVAVEALEHKVLSYKARRAKLEAINKMNELQEQGKLSDERFQEICQDALKIYGKRHRSIDYLKGLEGRIKRRFIDQQRQFPYLLIDPLDQDVRSIPRGTVGLVLAKYAVGKSLLLTYLAYAYALQGFNVLYVTLEDPRSEVEDRLDGLLTGLPVRNLVSLPEKLRRRFKTAREKIGGRIKIVDATEEPISVLQFSEMCDRERNRGNLIDVGIIDYDDEIQPPRVHKGDHARRMEFADIYRALRKCASVNDLFLWTAAQTSKIKDTQMIVRGDDAAEDVSKVRKVAMCIGVGAGPSDWGEDSRHLFIARHKFDRKYIGWSVMGDFQRGIFYSREATERMLLKEASKQQEEE